MCQSAPGSRVSLLPVAWKGVREQRRLRVRVEALVKKTGKWARQLYAVF